MNNIRLLFTPKKRRYLWLLLFFLSGKITSFAQGNYPVSVTPLLSPTSELRWSTFYSSANFLRVAIRLKDNTKTDVPLFLRFKLERVGLVIQSKQDYVPTKAVANLAFGNQQILSGIELQDMLNPQNVSVQGEGLSQQSLAQGVQLPDGFYTLTLTAFEFDATRGYRQISNMGVSLLTIFKGYPPLITAPYEGQVLPEMGIQNTLFQWMPRASAATLGGLLYEVGIYLLEEGEDPNQAVLVKQPITGLPIATNLTSLAYGQGVGHTLLETGKRYAIRVQVTDPSGKNTYLNNGFSQVVSFYYGQPCLPPPTPLVTKVTTKTFSLEWKKQPAAQWYEVSFRHNEQFPWELQTAYFTNATLPKIENHDGDYRFKVRSVCSGNRLSQWSDEAQVLPQKKPNVREKANPSVATLPPTTTSLDDLLNPFDITVSTGGQTDEEIKEEYERIRSIKATTDRCGAAIVNEVGCEPVNYDYSGTETFSFAPAKLMYLNGYEILITAGNATQGEGLLYYPYIAGRLAVQWNGLTVVKGSEGEDYGCITSGEAIVQGSDGTVLQDDLKRQLLALLNQGPGSFTGKFGEALEQMDKLITDIQSGAITPDAATWKKLEGMTKAAEKGFQDWSQSLREQFGGSPVGVEIELLNALDQKKNDINVLAECLASTTSSSSPASQPKKGGGNFVLKNIIFSPPTCPLENGKGGKPLVDEATKTAETLLKPATDPADCEIGIVASLPANLTFVSPDGRLISLPKSTYIRSYAYDGKTLPEGTILGFKGSDGVPYAARILYSSGSHIFKGYINYTEWTTGNNGKPKSAEQCQVYGGSLQIPSGVTPIIFNYNIATRSQSFYEAQYAPAEITEGKILDALSVTINANKGELCHCLAGQSKPVIKEDYGTLAGRQKMQQQLAKYGLDDVGVEITDKNGEKHYITASGITQGSPTSYKPTNFKVTENANGDIDIDATFKEGCSGCSAKAKEVFGQALQNAKNANGGKVGLGDAVVKKQTILDNLTGISGGIKYDESDLGDWLSAIAKGYNTIIDNAKVPEEMWKTGKTFPVRDFTGVISGSADQVIEDGKDMAGMVGMGLTIISNPTKARDDLVAFTQNITWDKAGEMLKTVVKEGTNYNYLSSSDAQDVRYGIGRSAVTLVKAATGTGLVAMLKSPDELAGLMAKVKRLLDKLKSLIDAKHLDVLEADLADDVLYAALEADNELVKSWEVLQRNGRRELKLKPDALQALNTLKKNQKLIDMGISDDILGKMNGFKIPPQDFSYAQICDKVGSFVDDLPMDKVDKAGLERFLGTSNLGNASSYNVRQGVLGMDVVKANKAFLANADNIFLEHKFTGLPYNAEPDLFFTKGGKNYIAEFKAGTDFFTGNFNDQCKAYFGQVSDLQGLRIFSRPDVAVTKSQIIAKWKSGGVLSNGDALSQFRKYSNETMPLGAADLENYLTNNDDWFNMIFNSNF
jgi:hypothetical protein